MIVAGVMSGTSADGINVALVQLSARGRGRPRHTLLAHEEYPFPAPVRRALQADADFGMAHCLRGYLFLMSFRADALPAARAALTEARRCPGSARDLGNDEC